MSNSFTAEDLHLVMAMCKSANPWFPDKPMIPAWQSVYDSAQYILETEFCHCGEHIYTQGDGFTRNLCLGCTLERCDVPDGSRFSCQPVANPERTKVP